MDNRTRVLVIALQRIGLPKIPDYYVSSDKAAMMVAAGRAVSAGDGTRRIFERNVRPRGESRYWRKVTNRSKNGAALFSTMQLVPGVSQGRNTGAR